MEERYKRLDKSSKKMIIEAGLQKPSPDFLVNVMSLIEQRAIYKVYQPLITKKAWLLIGLILLLAVFVVIMVPLSHVSFFGIFDTIESMKLKNPFSEVKISKITIYGIGFIGLFLFQIPFLKKYLNRRYI